LICEYPEAKVDLFKVLDQEQKGYITPEDICQFYGERSSKFPKGAYSIVERYFRFNEGSLTLDEFSTVLESKNCHVVTPEADENPFDVFHHMIGMAIEYYIEIEKVRVRLCCEAENL
jgi:Ca2+-binding EF-hand superfamily protein